MVDLYTLLTATATIVCVWKGKLPTAEAMLDAYDFDEDVTSVMDFACGSGSIARELAPFARRIVGVDIDVAKVNLFQEHIQNQGIPPEEMQAICADLKGEATELDGEKFDVIVCSAAYHHFPHIDETTHTLASFLRPGGCLLVVDFLSSTTPIPEDVPHTRGFSENDLRHAFDHAGLIEVDVAQLARARFHGASVDLFLAQGVKSTQIQDTRC